MPEPAERPIEKWLRRYAAGRRARSGSAPELHPATRRLLHAEIRKRLGIPRPASPGLFSFFRPIWAWGAGMAALGIVCIMAFVLHDGQAPKPGVLVKNDFLPGLDGTAKEKFEPQTVMATDALVRFEAVTNMPVPVAAVAFPSQAAPYESALRESRAAVAKEVQPAASVPPAEASSASTMRYGLLAPKATPASRDALPTAPPSPAPTLREEEPLVAGGRFNESQMKQLADTVDGIGGLAGNYFDKDRGRQLAGTTARQLSKAAALSRAKADAASLTLTNVLTSFQVEQNGQFLRILDSDGSVYTGSVLVASTPQLAKQEQPVSVRRQAMAVSNQADSSGRPALDLASANSLQNSYFRVAGVNQSLKQQVVFTGNFAPVVEIAASPGASNVAAPAQTQAAMRVQNRLLQNNASLLNSRISGQAVTSDGRTVEVNAIAVPAAQR